MLHGLAAHPHLVRVTNDVQPSATAEWMTEKGCGRLAGIAGAAGGRLKEAIGGIGLA